jgi:parallel beta-helix repeat protein
LLLFLTACGGITPVTTSNVHNQDTGVGYDTIQEAIDAATDGQTIIVNPSTYHENIIFSGQSITVQSSSPSNPAVVAATILDGGGSGSVVSFTEGDTSTLTGFTIRNGYATLGDRHGGGIVIAGSSPTIKGNIITGNTAKNGGGIYMDLNSFPVIENNFITQNTADANGGGIGISYSSSPTIKNNSITNNTEGGINIYSNCSPNIIGNTISGNTGDGGIMMGTNCSPIIKNNTITGNVSDYRGGGIDIYSGCFPTVMDNIIQDNKALDRGGGIYVSSDSGLYPSNIRPDGWGTGRENIPTGDPLTPAEGEVYVIAGNQFLGNEQDDPLKYGKGAHVYFQADSSIL